MNPFWEMGVIPAQADWRGAGRPSAQRGRRPPVTPPAGPRAPPAPAVKASRKRCPRGTRTRRRGPQAGQPGTDVGSRRGVSNRASRYW
jgi:hypothetical protein